MNAGFPAVPLVADVRIAKAIYELAVARGSTADKAQQKVYLRQLEDLDPGLVERACYALGKLPRREYQAALPEVGLIRERVAEIARQDADCEAARKLLPLPAADDDPRTWVHCPDCHDESSCWREVWCIGGGAMADRESHSPHHRSTRPILRTYCGRKMAHGPHSYVMRCGCWETNPVIAARRAAQARPTTEAR
jgi:hypothetical protein